MLAPVAGQPADRRRELTLAACIIGSSLAFIDATVVIVALPTIEADLGLGLSGQQWVFLSYSLALASLYLVAGSIGDRFGRRGAFVAGAAGFALASVLAGAAPNGETLIAARVLQGIAGAFLTTNSLALIRSVYGDDAGRAIGLWTAFTSIATIAGPPAGGAIVEWTSWRWIFFLNLPIAVVVFFIASPKVPESRDVEAEPHLDLPGAAIAAVFLSGLTFALIEGSRLGWTSPPILAGFVVGAMGFVAFILTERRSRQPMVPLSIFANRTFSSVNVATLLIYAALAGASLYLVLDVQQGRGFSAVAGGASLLPVTLTLLVGSPLAGRLADRVGPRLPMTLGPAVAGAGLLFAMATAHVPSYWTSVFPSVVIFAVGLALTVAPLTTAVLSALEPGRAGIASGVNSALSRFGGLVAVAILPALSLVGFTHGLEQRLSAVPVDPAVRTELLAQRAEQGALSAPTDLPPDERALIRNAVRASFADGFRWVMLVCAILLFAGATISFIELRPTTRVPDAFARADRSGDPRT
jgi:EmrB/QacA subfamily drug resistance transporter